MKTVSVNEVYNSKSGIYGIEGVGIEVLPMHAMGGLILIYGSFMFLLSRASRPIEFG